MAMKGRDWRFREAIKKNETFFFRLTKAFDFLGKDVLATAAAASLEVAMRETLHDSARASANWDINVRNANPYGRKPDQLDPKDYEDSKYGVGKRGDREKGRASTNAATVASKKRQKYGYTIRGSANVDVKPGGWLYDTIGVGKIGTAGVHLFNPIMTMIPRYSYNAFQATITEIEGKAKIEGANAASVRVGKFIKEANAAIRAGKLGSFEGKGYRTEW